MSIAAVCCLPHSAQARTVHHDFLIFQDIERRSMHLSTSPKRRSWRLEDIALNAIDAASVRDDEFLFLTLASASFVEILSDMYSDNLIEHFRGNPEVTDWLGESWQQDEVRHGR